VTEAPQRIVIRSSGSAPWESDVEIVERKGIGHPDTMCDALAEEFSRALCEFYLERFGTILHHNVDKALLRGGSASAHFGGGEVLEPIDVYLAGRAVTQVGDIRVPVEQLAIDSARSWLETHLHALDPVRHVRIHCLVRPGSVALSTLFGRRDDEVPLANDTSFGVGFAPLSALEQFTLRLEQELDSPDFIREHPSHGEDVKIMAVRAGPRLSVTLARAFVAAHVPTLSAYASEKQALETMVRRAAATLPGEAEIRVNAADSLDGSDIYLTVTGTSAESGDDGEVGRGNRANGLITPFRPMSLEALAGKNPVNHVGKLYNIAARRIAEQVVSEVTNVVAADCQLVSRIGAPITRPEFASVSVRTTDDLAKIRPRVEEIVGECLVELPKLWRRVLDGAERLY